MTKNRTDPNSFYYRQTHKGPNYETKKYWQPGEELGDSDLALLQKVKDFYQQNHYPPSQKDFDIELIKELKNRFRTWKNILLAAELPALNAPEAQKKRQQELEKQKGFWDKREE